MRSKKIISITVSLLILSFIFLFSLSSSSEFLSLISSTPSAELERFIDAWDRGDYLVALKGFERLLSSAPEEIIFEKIALQTGSLFKIKELAPDGRNPRFSPDGQYLAFDIGSRENPSILVFKTGQNYEKIMEIKGFQGALSPSGQFLAYYFLPESEEIKSLRKELAQLRASSSPDRSKMFSLQARLSFLEAREAKLILKDLTSGQERIIDPGSLLKGDFVFNSDGTKIFMVASLPEEIEATQIYALSVVDSNGPLISPLTQGSGYKINPIVSPNGRYLVYQRGTTDPFSRQTSSQRSLSSPDSQPPRQSSAIADESPSLPPLGQLGRQQVRAFGLVDLANGQTKFFEGTSPVFSPKGDYLAYLGREGNENFLALVKLEGELSSLVLKKTSSSLASPSFSPDGKKLALEISLDNNNEILVIDLATKNEQRITREIQHDRQPRFLSPDMLVAIKGEPRHSRSYLYDLRQGTAIRLFHNETIRTIAPEYEWAFHPDGKTMVIVADYDGDTISPERGVYLLDLSQKITPEELLIRIKKQAEEEAALRAKAQEFIRPLASQIKELISGVSRRRLYEYQKNLFAFESKHVSQPGNLKAIEFLQKTLTSFGYDVELQWLPNRPYKTANVVAVLKGKENPELYYVLGSHFDSVARGAGADDNSSSIAVLLETARLLANNPLPSSLIFAAFTGEESGLWGSQEFVRLAKERNLRVLGAINNDTIGWTEDHRLDNTIRYANSGLRDLMHAASIGFSRMVTYDSRYIKSTDAVPLYEAFGNVVAGLGSYPILGNPYYHTPLDRLEVVNQELIEEATKFMIATVVMMVSCPSPVRDLKARIKEKNLLEINWTANPEKGIDHYLVTFELVPKGQAISQKVKDTQLIVNLDNLLKKLVKKKEDLKTEKIELKISVKAKNQLGLSSWDDSIFWLKLD